MSQKDQVHLRPVEERDLEMLARIDTDPSLSEPFEWRGFRDPRRHRRRFEADGYLGDDESRLVVALGDGSFAGTVGWRTITMAGGLREWCVEIGILLLPEHRGRGIGSEAQRLLAEYLFSTTPVYRLQAATEVENLAEQRALERAGFRREGVARGGFARGHPVDGVRYARLRSDLLPAESPGGQHEYRGEFRYVFYTPPGRYEETVAFYREVLDLQVMGGFTGGTYFETATGAVLEVIDPNADDDGLGPLVLRGHKHYRPPQGAFLLIEVPDADAAAGRVRDHAVALLQDVRDWPWRFRDFKVVDPAGNIVSLFSRLPGWELFHGEGSPRR